MQNNNQEGGLLIAATIKKANNIDAWIEKSKPTTQEPQRFTRRIGSTTFRVVVYFNPEAKDTAEAKISRLVRMDAESSKVGAV